MRNRKHFLWLTAMFMMVCLVMTGCASTDQTQPGVTDDPQATVDTGAVTDAPSGDTVNLRVWVGDNEDVAWINQVIERFKAANPSKTYNIDVGVQNEGDCSKVVLSDPEAAADVFTFADDQFNSLYNAGALMEVVDDPDGIRAANTEDSVAAATGQDGKLYAYPATADNGYFMFYNTEYFTADDVQTMDGMLAKAAEAGKYVAYPMSNGWYFYSFFKGAGLDMHVMDDGVTNTCNWNATDTEITGVEVMQALLDIAANPGFREADSDPFVAGVKDGSIIAGVSGTWNANVAAEAWGDSYAATKLPTFTVAGRQVQMASFSGFKLVGVNKYSDNVGDAMDFAAFMTNYESQVSRFEMRRQGPSNVEALASDVVQAEPAIAAVVSQTEFADVQRVGSKYWDPAAALGKIIVNGNPDNQDLQTLLDNAVAGITAPADQ
ncbi:MAG: extracellular solute-binding protein [Christensenellaceae bacterium]|nr:extracellular solute-binding protein [Christensenellaceae bacterium]